MNVIYIRVSQHVLEATVIRQVLLHPQAMLGFNEIDKVANTHCSFEWYSGRLHAENYIDFNVNDQWFFKTAASGL
jgi:hypothetical protein